MAEPAAQASPAWWADGPAEYDWAQIDYCGQMMGDRGSGGWATVSAPPGPSPDPPPAVAIGYVTGSPEQRWMHDHRGQFSKARLKDGAQCYIGPPPKNSRPAYEGGVYVGYRPCGRPRKYQSNAERQKAYRRRKDSSESDPNDQAHHHRPAH